MDGSGIVGTMVASSISPSPPDVSSPRNRLLDRILVVVIAVALGAIGLFGHLFDARAIATSPRAGAAGFPLDDAWIHQVYARSLSEHGRFDYNPGEAELGSSSPLWTVLLAPLHALGEEDGLPKRVRFVGMLSWALLALAAANLARRLFSPAPRTAAAVAACLVAARPEFGFAASSGMEPLLFAALAAFALERVFAGRPAAAGILAGLACATRPEGIAIAAVVIGFAACVPSPTASRLGGAWRAALGCAPFVLAWSAFCSFVAGRPLPNTYYAKAESIPFSTTLDQMGTILSRLIHDSVFYRAPTSYLLLVIGIVGILARAGIARGVALLAAPFALIAGVAASRTLPSIDAFYWSRYSLPAAPFLDLFLAIGIAGALASVIDLSRPTDPKNDAPADDEEQVATPTNSRSKTLPQAAETNTAPRSAGLEVPKPILSILLFVLAILPFVSVADGMRSAIERFGKEVADVDATNVAAARFLSEQSGLGPNDVIAAQDAGAVRYFAPSRVVDILGLNDHELVRTFLEDGDVGRYLTQLKPRAFFLLDPDAGAQPFVPLARALGLTPLQRFAVPDYSVLGTPTDKGVVLYLRPSR